MRDPAGEFRKVSGVVRRTLPGLVFCVYSPADPFSPLLHRRLAAELERAGIATRFLQLLNAEEQADDAEGCLRLNVASLRGRITAATDAAVEASTGLAVGLFSTASCTAPCLAAAAARPNTVRSVVSFGGRPDLAVFALAALQAPTLLLVRRIDEASRHFAEIAASHLRDKHEVHVLPKLQGRFQESGELDLVCTLATSWFVEAFSAQEQDDAATGRRE
jgi:hypothetical protein